MDNAEEIDTFTMQYGKMGPYAPKEDRGYHDGYPPLEVSAADPLPVIDVPDSSGRIGDIDLDAFHGGSDDVSSIVYRAYSDAPAIVPLSSDSRRLALHAMGNETRPAGVAETAWRRLDVEKFSVPGPVFRLRAEPVYEIPVDAGYMAPAPVIPPPPEVTGDAAVDESHDPSEMPFLDHLEEFRWAILKSLIALGISMILGWFLGEYFLGTIQNLAEKAQLDLIFTKLMEPIMVRLQMALVIGLVIALPFVFYFLWSFVAPGLYKNEKRWIMPLVWGATACFFVGASLAFFIIIPLLLQFVKVFMPTDILAYLTIGDFISVLLKFTLLFGIIFEMPMVTFALAKIGLLKYTWMVAYRKYAIVVIFILGAIFTPPDPMSQIVMAMPLIVLYEISIWVARFAGRKSLI